MLTNDERKVLKETRDDLKRILRRIERTLAIDAPSKSNEMEDQSEREKYIVTQYIMRLGVPTEWSSLSPQRRKE